MKKRFRKFYCRLNKKKVLGILLFLVGLSIILKVLPVSIWFFIFGLIILIIGLFFIKTG
ncbi:hypothetical protein [Anaerosalibacter massiliensis]|uniref:Uncharacterized protein n=1 Tax=Anaerosalibacter massiliensis TaxID=1347392 RepID=A0A9X2MGC7_9FIRM|nr:hypothetical protein [Anaerosalibacter massiliensis]MCR2042580.1 hypothetical protein [Anaerosalibacter massiliensis]